MGQQTLKRIYPFDQKTYAGFIGLSSANWYVAVKTKPNALIKIIKIILYHTAGRIIFQSEKGINSNIVSIDNGKRCFQNIQ